MTRDGGFDRLRRMLERIEQRDADGTDRRDCRRVRNRHAHRDEESSVIATPEA